MGKLDGRIALESIAVFAAPILFAKSASTRALSRLHALAGEVRPLFGLISRPP
jgi:hypothetical protein